MKNVIYVVMFFALGLIVWSIILGDSKFATYFFLGVYTVLTTAEIFDLKRKLKQK